MGRQLEAICNNCNYKKEKIFFGATESSYKESCSVPAIDLSTGQLVTANWKQREELKDKFVFYTEHELYGGEKIDLEGDWGLDCINAWDAIIREKGNKCPNCNHYSMKFETVSLMG